MFIHFDSDKGTACDNCGERGTIMQMSMVRVDQSFNLCRACFGAVAQVFMRASEKLKINRAQC
jgi:ribosomal protein S14